VENGADAIYFGLERFNARMRAHNFTAADLPRLMEFLHRRGVRGYVTFNTLVFANELADAKTYLRGIITAGVDAAIVQDVGICRLIRALSPDFPIHASTQMTVTSAAGVEFARELGAQLVVLARENSLKDIAAIREAREPATAPLPLEVFVHGALCVAYSGQCLTSESLGGRSANRGECAQACRLPYELVSDGRKLDLGDRRYLLSPQDLAGLDVLPDLVRAGVAALKIEGRLKSPEYVANITRVYRRALDQVMAEVLGPCPRTEAEVMREVSAASRYDLEMGFSRGLSTGWFRGIDNQQLVHARFGTKRGVFLGTVTHIRGESVALRLEAPLKPGDGIVFDAGHPEVKEEGGRVYQVQAGGAKSEAGGAESGAGDRETVLRFGRGDIDFSRLHVGDRVWKTNDPELDRRLRHSFEGEPIRFRRPIHFEVHGHAGTALTLVVRDDVGHVAQVASTVPLSPAERQPLTTERLRHQLGRLGGTPYELGQLTNHLDGAVIIPVSELNELRRRGAAELDARRAAPKRWQVREKAEWLDPKPRERVEADAPHPEPELIIVTRNLAQLQAALSCPGVGTFYCEFENPKHYREAVARFRDWQAALASKAPSESRPPPSTSLWVAAPRVFKPGEEWILRQVLSCEADGYLVRNYDHLPWFKDRRRRGDFSLNVANPLTADHYINRHGLERVTASYDLNVAQLEALLQAAPPAWFDITLHQHMPMFHMEHCVFCAFLSDGTDYRNCGRPCEKHAVSLRDRIGAEHPLKADAGCRNTVYNSRAQTGAEFAPKLIALGARSFRLEFLNESPDELRRTVGRYRQLLHGEITGAELWREFKFINQLGVTRGQLEATPPTLRRKA
jgi:putative protease